MDMEASIVSDEGISEEGRALFSPVMQYVNAPRPVAFPPC